MIHRESGVLKTTYEADMALYPLPIAKWTVGAIVGGLIVGIVENVAAGYIDPYVGGGTKDFAPYVLMIAALMVRPYGIFGKRIIERV